MGARRAAAAARSRIAASAGLTEDYESDYDVEVEETPRRSIRTGANSNTQAQRSRPRQEPEWYIAIDFGTTFTTVAWYRRGTPIQHIFTIDNFPGEKQYNQTRRQIPTEIWYPRKDTRQQRNVKPRDVRMRFGNEVHRMAEGDEGSEIRRIYDDADRVTMMKLLLDKSDYAQASKERLQETLESIKMNGHIDEDEDVFFHFFREVFKATKSRLGPDFVTESTVELIFCVPVCYNPSAVATIGAQIERAMQEVQFGTDGESPCNIFILHEAEAQATQALLEHVNELERGETIIFMDVGGGTTDIGIYRIALTEPFRLGSEVHEAMGAMVGAGDLNDRFRNLVRGILRREVYLLNGEENIHDVVAAEVMHKFEVDIKRSFQYNDTEATYHIRIRGLKESRHDDRIQDNDLVLTYQDIWNIFRPSVKKIGNLMEDAVINAQKAGYAISKVVVVGGFGDSPCLQSYLSEQKDQIVRKLKQPLKLRFSPRNTSATGVATGAILRAINKADGPSRIPCQSIGVLRHIPCDDEDEEYSAEVLAQEREWSPQEEGEYIMDTISWVVKKNDALLDSVHTVTFESQHVFQPDEPEWIIDEKLWASESCVLDFYKTDHPHNAGKTMEIGAVEFDVSDLRQRIREENRMDGKLIDKAVILVEMTVIDRNLEFTARWPPTPEGEVIQGSRKFFSVASAFIPGTN